MDDESLYDMLDSVSIDPEIDLKQCDGYGEVQDAELLIHLPTGSFCPDCYFEMVTMGEIDEEAY